MSFSRRDRLRLLFRSFALQGSWNFPRMQGLGFLYAIAPWLRKAAGKDARSVFRLHLGYFNTNPYMATYVLGVVARLEEEGRGEESVQMRTNLMGPLGAIGDGLYWASFRPLCLLSALLIATVRVEAAPVFFIIAYNAVHIADRWFYLNFGYEKAHEAIKGALSLKDRSVGRVSRILITPLAGFLLGFTVFATGTPGIALLVFASAFILYRRKWRTPVVLAVILFLAIVLGFFGARTSVPWSV
ncbi:MAG: PTS system mannose/fructose/sorbose family transporter subunit IID [bacterium]|nr:PTS system mannose/fructose/sorbose family transporter subunit IID [bacterium]MDT8394904.1 PTS system mannose/fructose/sorbose family transporter subunit IID [bacterium]